MRYVFTDVSEVFLVKARARFTEYDFIDYMLLNIDADPRLQSLGSREFHIVVSTNCLHAPPFMTNTLRYCHQLLCPGGFLVANEAVRITAFSQITFGLTDGWWLFAEVEDPERIGQESPLLSWSQWESLLADSGFERAHCMRGDSFLRSQAVLVAQAAAAHSGEDATKIATALDSTAAAASGAHLLSGGLGGLGLLTARLLIESGATQLVLSSRSDRVVAGSEADWEWLAAEPTRAAAVRLWCL